MMKPLLFGRYYLIEQIGRGGMADIYFAKTVSIDGFEKPLAIKMVKPELASDPDFVRRFVEEAKIQVQLTHGNIVPVFDMGVHAGRYYIAMEYIEGKNVRDFLAKACVKAEEINPQIAAYIAIEVCKGLAYAHRKEDRNGNPLRIVHRDVSPQNILISYEGEVKLVDFGIAEAAGRDFMEKEGVLAGKLFYMSPEQATGGKVDPRSDIYSVGCVLFELLTTGQKLFNIEDSEELFATVCQPGDFAYCRVMEKSAFIPPELRGVIIKALAPDPGDRYESMESFQLSLMDYLHRAGSVVTASDIAALMKRYFIREMQEEKERLTRAKVVSDLLKEAEKKVMVPMAGAFSKEELFEIETSLRKSSVKEDGGRPRTGFEKSPESLTEESSTDTLKYLKIVPAGTVIFRQGDGGEDFYLIKDGKVKIVREIKGEEKVLAVLGMGDFFGEMSVLTGMPRSATAEAVEDTILLVVPSDFFVSLVKSNGDIAVRLMQRLALRLKATDDIIENLVLREEISALIKSILNFCATEDPSTGGVRLREVGISELLRSIGVQSIDLVRECLAKLHKSRIVRVKRGVLTILDYEKLREYQNSIENNGEFGFRN